VSIDPQYIVQLQGRPFVLFAGLLDAAHKTGLKSIITTPVQIPTPENGRLAVMKARVEMESGQVYEAIGDASPESVGRMIAPHLLRMAETRSIGRALRWALNVSVTMREELADEPDPKPGDRRPPPIRHGPVCAACRTPLTANEVNTSRKYQEELNNRMLCEDHLKEAAAAHKAAKNSP
jgi:hypothetical protein